MGSLQSEIQRTLNTWNGTPPVAPVPQRNKSIAYRVFDFVQKNPTATADDVVKATGVDLGRASATLLSLYQKGKLDRKAYPNPNPTGKRHEVYTYWTAVDNFTDKGVDRRPKKPKKAKPLSKAELLIQELDLPARGNARSRIDMPRMKQFADEVAPIKQEFDPEAFVKGLSLTEVKQLHKFLESYFE